MLLAWLSATVTAQIYNQMDESGQITQIDETANRNFNKHNKDTSHVNKEIPKGLYVWTIDRKFGDMTPAKPDTMPHLFMNTVFNTGLTANITPPATTIRHAKAA